MLPLKRLTRFVDAPSRHERTFYHVAGCDSSPAVRLRRHPLPEFVVPSIVRAELEFGALKGGSSIRLQNVQAFLAQFPTLPFDDICVASYSSARNELERTGQKIGALDLMIAAIALTHRLVLVTHNTAEFSRVPGLQFEDWQAEGSY